MEGSLSDVVVYEALTQKHLSRISAVLLGH